MIADMPTITVPIKVWKDGSIRIGDTRVLLEIILWAYLRGDSPADIAYAFDSVTIAQVSAAIAYYHANQSEVDAYLAEVERVSEANYVHYVANLTPEQIALRRRMVEAKNYRAPNP